MNVDALNGKHKKDECCGCTACVEICPVNAIRMTADSEGFLYPSVDAEKCIDCGKCICQCAFLNDIPEENPEKPIAYGLRHLDENVRSASRSGGAFTLISQWFLNQGGAVYGAGYTEAFRVVHKRAMTESARDEFRRSKYVQSDMTGVIEQIKQDIEEGKLVLFSGTACQVAGVQKACVSPNLYTIDIVCHGAPSPLIWEKYLAYVKEKCKETKILDVDFRTKAEFGWRSHIEKVVFEDKIYYSSKYRQLFYNDSALRPSCYNCKYTSLRRPADFTIGDFWGLEDKSFDDNKGVSLVICNNQRAEKIFSQIQHRAKVVDYDAERLIHPSLKHPTACPRNRADFWSTYAQSGIQGLIKKHTMPGVVEYALIGLSWLRKRLSTNKE